MARLAAQADRGRLLCNAVEIGSRKALAEGDLVGQGWLRMAC
jgi:hypothetical protein